MLSSLKEMDQFGLLESLKKLDPLRKNYYSDQRKYKFGINEINHYF